MYLLYSTSRLRHKFLFFGEGGIPPSLPLEHVLPSTRSECIHSVLEVYQREEYSAYLQKGEQSLLRMLIYGVGVVVTAFLGVCAVITAFDFGKKVVQDKRRKKVSAVSTEQTDENHSVA